MLCYQTTKQSKWFKITLGCCLIPLSTHIKSSQMGMTHHSIAGNPADRAAFISNGTHCGARGKSALWSPISAIKCLVTEVTHITSAHRALVTINHMATTTKGPGNAILLWHGCQKAGNICVTALVITTGLNKVGLFSVFLKFTIY